MKRICILSIIIALAALGANAQTVTGSGVMAVPVFVNATRVSRSIAHSPDWPSAPRPPFWSARTCTEFVQISGFEGLTLKGLPGATLQQPSGIPERPLIIHVLLIEASRSITIDGFAIHSRASALDDIGIGRNWRVAPQPDRRRRQCVWNLCLRAARVSLARVTARDPGFATVGVVDISDVHIESSLFENSTGASFREGLFVSTGHVTMQTTTIRNMQVGIGISDGGIVDIQSFNSTSQSLAKGCGYRGSLRDQLQWRFGWKRLLAQPGRHQAPHRNSGQPWGGNTGERFRF